MYNINFIVQNFDAFKASMKARGFNDFDLNILIDLDSERKTLISKTEEAQGKKNSLAKQIANAKSSGSDISNLMEESNKVKESLVTLEFKTNELLQKIDSLLCTIPNMTSQDVPIGRDESENVEVKKWGSIPKFDFTPKDHSQLGADLEMMDFESAAKVSGSRFVYLYKHLARLERAIKNFLLDHNTSHGFVEVSVPLLVKEEAFFGTGQLPKFDGDFFKTTNGYYLIPTAEVSLTNIVRNSITEEKYLPLRFTSLTPCFRSEAGSAGKDTKGMIRNHQFYKAELVSVCSSDTSEEEHQKMLVVSESVLQKLNLPYRVVVLCTGDTGFCASKTYDIEVFLPGQNKYREIASISNTKDFQARRMMARYKKSTDKKNEYLHTLNGSSMPVGRLMVAIIENYQQKDGSIAIPKDLVSYCGFEQILSLKK